MRWILVEFRKDALNFFIGVPACLTVNRLAFYYAILTTKEMRIFLKYISLLLYNPFFRKRKNAHKN